MIQRRFNVSVTRRASSRVDVDRRGPDRTSKRSISVASEPVGRRSNGSSPLVELASGRSRTRASASGRRVEVRAGVVVADDAGFDAAWRAGLEGAFAAVPNSNLRLDFNVSVRECFDATSLASLRELDESNRFVQKSAESTSI